MADTKITALTALTGADPANDVIPIVDVSDTTMAASGTTKKISVNNILGASGTATLASATISGDLTVNSNVNVGASPTFYGGKIATNGSIAIAQGNYLKLWNSTGSGVAGINAGAADTLTFSLTNTFTTAMTLNSTGLGVGVVPSAGKFEVQESGTGAGIGGIFASTASGGGNPGVVFRTASTNRWSLSLTGSAGAESIRFYDINNSATRLLIDTSGNVGIGVTPSAWGSFFKSIESGAPSAYVIAASNVNGVQLASNCYNDNTNWLYKTTGTAARFAVNTSQFQWFTAPSGTAGTAITFTQAMTLDASGNLLVGTTSSVGKFNLTQTANANAVCVNGNVGNFLNFYGWSADSTWNTNATAIFVGKNTSTSRSINAGGTVNASGADYAEYMTKSSDFVLSKGDIAGIDTNGKLTNVFADAVSFVVKSTDPSYVGNDKWGIGLEGDALEFARQLVDRIAFAGQVPVNVIGAKAGDYIVPVVDGTRIKGIAVSNPTFEQYQLAVGKVIAIDADGRARIIVKVA